MNALVAIQGLIERGKRIRVIYARPLLVSRLLRHVKLGRRLLHFIGEVHALEVGSLRLRLRENLCRILRLIVFFERLRSGV